MQVYIGGAYNGKREYVKKQLASIPKESIHFFDGVLPNPEYSKKDVLILMNFEKLVPKFKGQPELEVAQDVINRIRVLEEQANVICILTDLGRGIVPLEEMDRFIRDCCGRIYQQLFQRASSVTRIWYGIPETIKGD